MAQKVAEYGATGRRKTAVARVRLALGVGKTRVNGKEFDPVLHDRIRSEVHRRTVGHYGHGEEVRYRCTGIRRWKRRTGRCTAARHFSGTRKWRMRR